MAKKAKYNGEPTKERLKTMAKNSRGHYFRTKGRILKYGASGFFRHIWLSLAATVVTTFTLVILFATIIASVILSSTADYMRQKIDITVYFVSETTDEELERMAAAMRLDSNVTNVEVANSAEEYNYFVETVSDNQDIMTSIENDEDMANAVLSVMPAKMRIKVKDSNNLDSIKNIVDNNPDFMEFVDPVRMPTYDTDRTEIATITSWANVAKNGGLVLSAIFLVISILVIFNTIRMAIFSRREEIYMEKLIGADNRFIRGPFLVEAEICGVLAGIVASVIGVVAFNILAPKLSGYGIHIDSITNIVESYWIVLVFAAMIIVGWLINTASARLAVRKYLR